MATTLKDLRQGIGGLGFCADMLLTTAISGSDSTKIVDNKLVRTNDAFNYYWVAVVSGSATGDRRVIADWVQSTYTLTPDRNFTAAVSSGDGYELHRLFSPSSKDDAVNQAIREQRKWLRRVEDETITIVAGTYRYRVDNLIVGVDATLGIDDLYTKASTDTEWARVDPNLWWIEQNGAYVYLMFKSEGMPATSNTLRLQYRAYSAALSADTSTLSPDDPNLVNFIKCKAAGLLFQQKADQGEEKPNGHWQNRASEMERKAEMFYGLRTHLPPKPSQKVALW